MTTLVGQGRHCRVYWGSHGCEKRRGHWWRHRCDCGTGGYPPPWCNYFGDDVRLVDRLVTRLWRPVATRRIERTSKRLHDQWKAEQDAQVLYGEGRDLDLP